ncbi:hypothetical protein DSO57_1035899 [Entomophthora muscae]|uniref:Uncharacterized protein n=1 Tax=Entomophthora muscae TaxID=34485 RepID=A0ACC2TAD4_9FUNG|nr:hypothetical protein DSO57_1035899 [Entomophthora muscae]
MAIGTLCVTVVEARKLVNKDGFLGKNDPFVSLKVGSNKQKTPVVNNAGSKAAWDLKYEFEVFKDKDVLEVECFDFDKVTCNDLIGKIKIPLQSLCSNRLIECWYPLEKNHEFQGEVNLILEFFPTGSTPHGAGYQSHSPQPGYPPQNPGYPPQNPGYPPQNPVYPPQNPGYPPQNLRVSSSESRLSSSKPRVSPTKSRLPSSESRLSSSESGISPTKPRLSSILSPRKQLMLKT